MRKLDNDLDDYLNIAKSGSVFQEMNDAFAGTQEETELVRDPRSNKFKMKKSSASRKKTPNASAS